MELQNFKVVNVDTGAVKRSKRQRTKGSDAGGESNVTKMEELSQRYPDLPFFLRVDQDTKMAFQTIVANSEPTALLILDMLSVYKSQDALPSSQVVLADIVGEEGRQYLQCDAGRALFRLLNNDVPSELSLSALLQLSHVAGYFRAEHVLDGFFEHCQLGVQDLLADQVLSLLQNSLAGPHATEIGNMILPHLPDIAARLLPNIRDAAVVLDTFKQLQIPDYKFQRAFALLHKLQQGKWECPAQCALLSIGLLLAACSTCCQGSCAAKIAGDSTASNTAGAASSTCADVMRDALVRSIGFVRDIAPEKVTMSVTRELLQAGDMDDGACPCKRAMWQSVTTFTTLGPYAPLARLTCEVACSQITLFEDGVRAAVGARLTWPATGKHATGKLAVSNSTIPFRLTIHKANDGAMLFGVKNAGCLERRVRCRFFAADVTQDLTDLHQPFASWVVMGRRTWML